MMEVFFLFEKRHFYIGSVIPEVRMTNYSSLFLEEKETQIHSDSSHILLLIDSSLVKFQIMKILKGTLF